MDVDRARRGQGNVWRDRGQDLGRKPFDRRERAHVREGAVPSAGGDEALRQAWADPRKALEFTGIRVIEIDPEAIQAFCTRLVGRRFIRIHHRGCLRGNGCGCEAEGDRGKGETSIQSGDPG